jgi:hypothetical protein
VKPGLNTWLTWEDEKIWCRVIVRSGDVCARDLSSNQYFRNASKSDRRDAELMSYMATEHPDVGLGTDSEYRDLWRLVCAFQGIPIERDEDIE